MSTYFDAMTKAIEDYPVTDVDLEIIDVVAPNGAVNAREVASFRVRVTNRGPLELTDVTLHIYGQNGATVANNGAAAPFVSDFVTQVIPSIAAHGGEELNWAGDLKFKAPDAAQPSKTLVKATLEDWNCNLLHILNSHSDPLLVAPKGTYATEVFPA